ncbi:ribbon-helix-helix domain-containing protein [Pectobacterium sp. CHL-2024]
MSITISGDMDKLLDETAKSQGITKSDVIRRAFALLKVSEQEKSKGNSLGIIKEDSEHKMEVVSKIIGL